MGVVVAVSWWHQSDVGSSNWLSLITITSAIYQLTLGINSLLVVVSASIVLSVVVPIVRDKTRIRPKSPIHLHLVSLTDHAWAFSSLAASIKPTTTIKNEGTLVAVYGWKREGGEEKAIGASTTFSSNNILFCQASTSSISPAWRFHSVLFFPNLQPGTATLSPSIKWESRWGQESSGVNLFPYQTHFYSG